MKTPQTKQEKELLEVLEDVITQACYVQEANCVIFESMAISSYAWGMQTLAEYGIFEIVSESGRRIIAKAVNINDD